MNLCSRLRELFIRGCRCKLTSQLRAELQLDLSPMGLRRSATSLSEETSAAAPLSLKPCLGLKDLVAFGIASTIGAGIFVTTGVAGKNYTGPALFVSVMIAGLCCLMNALGYSEFSSRIPAAGSAYSYTYNTMGEFAAFLMGWVLLLEYGISAAATARGFAAYVGSLLSFAGVPCPALLVQMPVLQWLGPYFSICLIAPITVLVCVIIMTAGVEESSRFNRWVTGLNVALIVFFWGAGWFYIDWERFTPMAPFGTEGVLEGAGVLFFCFIGFDSVSTLSEEVKRPQRDIPLGIIGTLLAVTILYVGTSIVLIGMVPLNKLDDTAPLAGAFLYHNCRIIYVLVSFGAASTTFCTTFTCIMAQPRIFYRMSIDGLWFAGFHEIHPDSLLPVKGIWMSGLIIAITAALVNFDVLIRLISAGTLLSYTVVCAGVLIVRYTHQQHHTPHKVPQRCPTNNNQPCHDASSRSNSSYAPPSLFSLDADDDSEMFYSGDDQTPSTPIQLHAATSTPPLARPHSMPGSEVNSLGNKSFGIRSAPGSSTPVALPFSARATTPPSPTAAAAAAAERLLTPRPRRSRVGEAEALAGLTGGSLLSTSLLMTGPCGQEEAVDGRDLPLSLPAVVAEAAAAKGGDPTRSSPWPPEPNAPTPSGSDIIRSPYKGQGRLFVAAVHTLPWIFALITLLLGFALQTGASFSVTWSLAGVAAAITLVFLLLHAFHELSLREYFVHQLQVYRHQRRVHRSSSSATFSGDNAATLPMRQQQFNGQQMNGQQFNGQQFNGQQPFQQQRLFPQPTSSSSFAEEAPPPPSADVFYDSAAAAAAVDIQGSTASPPPPPGNHTTTAYPPPANISSSAVPADTTGRFADAFSRSSRYRTDHFRCPGVPLVPLAGIFLNSYLMASLQLVTIIHTLVYLTVGALIYIFYGAWHSTLHTSMYFESGAADPLLLQVEGSREEEQCQQQPHTAGGGAGH
eukprot:GHVS01037976.1.p1 GENE.GHVS01037976.1~~GHVS01037976.1.p1  ORF type:complete len:965 (-),score=173.87 GHVS01037976.1:232-3126(-)